MRDTGEANARNEDRNCQTEMHVVFPLAWICAETTICDGLLMRTSRLDGPQGGMNRPLSKSGYLVCPGIMTFTGRGGGKLGSIPFMLSNVGIR